MSKPDAPILPQMPEPRGRIFHEADEAEDSWVSVSGAFSEADMRAYALEAIALNLARAEEAFEKLDQWARAYPLSVFPEPDFDKAHEVLTAAGMTLDAISASNMRYVITQVKAIVDAARGQLPAQLAPAGAQEREKT